MQGVAAHRNSLATRGLGRQVSVASMNVPGHIQSERTYWAHVQNAKRIIAIVTELSDVSSQHKHIQTVPLSDVLSRRRHLRDNVNT